MSATTNNSEEYSRRSSGVSSPDSDIVGNNAANDLDTFDFVEIVNTKLQNLAEPSQTEETEEDSESKEAPAKPGKPFKNGLDMFAEEAAEFGNNYNVRIVTFTRFLKLISYMLKY